MSKPKADARVHSTKEGKLFIKASELFARDEVKEMIQQMMDSDLYRQIKQSQVAVAVTPANK